MSQALGPIYKIYAGPGALAGVNAVPYLRLCNPFSYQHHWTTDANEYNILVGSYGWVGEGGSGFVAQ